MTSQMRTCLFVLIVMKELFWNIAEAGPVPNFDVYWTDIGIGCQDGWDQHGPYCLYHVEERYSWHDAEKLCELYGARLLSDIQGPTETQYIANHLWFHAGISEFWIGMEGEGDGLHYVDPEWSSGELGFIAQGFWAPGHANPTLGLCVKVKWSEGSKVSEWNLANCDDKIAAVCMMDVLYTNGTFLCKDGGQIPKQWVCDDMPDCEDFTDEIYCRSPCTGDYVGESGVVERLEYYNDVYCYWTIQGPPDTLIKFTFTLLETEEDLDIVTIYAGGLTESTADKLGAYSGSSTKIPSIYSINNLAIVTFVSDSSVRGDGFTLKWNTVSPEELCGGEVGVNATVQYLHNPGYPDPTTIYHCIWHLYSVTGGMFTVVVEDVDLPEETSLVLFDPNDPFTDPLSLRSLHTPVFVVAESGEMVIRVKPVVGVSGYRGFRIQYQAECKVEIEADYGTIHSPHYGLKTYPSVDCTWKIRSTSKAPLALMFTGLFGLEQGFDFVKVYAVHPADKMDTLHPGEGFTGSDRPDDSLFGDTSELMVVMDNSAVLGDIGFMANFSIGCTKIEVTAGSIITGAVTYHYGSEFTVECPVGHRFTHMEHKDKSKVHAECLFTGRWNIHSSPTCEPKYCGPPPSLYQGYVKFATGVEYGDYIIYECVGTYLLVGSDQVYCFESGYWGDLPRCIGEGCQAIGAPALGSVSVVSGDGLSQGSVVEFTCQVGTVMEGVPVSICVASDWSDPVPQCLRGVCLTPDIPYATISPDLPIVEYDKVVIVQCDPGFELIGSAVMLCQADLSFSSVPFCRDVNECQRETDDCDLVCTNTLGSFTCSCPGGYYIQRNLCLDVNECLENNGFCDHQCHNEEAGYYCTCDPGFTLFTANGINQVFLPPGSSGLLSNDVLYFHHSCVRDICQPIASAILNGKRLSSKSSFNFGDSVSYHCDIGYEISGNAELNCLEDGTWDSAVPTCESITCWDTSTVVSSGASFPPLFPSPLPRIGYGEYLTADCDIGETMIDIQYLCTYDSFFDIYVLSGGYSDCPMVDCGFPVQLPGSVIPTLSSTLYGTTFTLQCDSSHSIYGSTTLGGSLVRCWADGLWQMGTLACKAKTCIDPGTMPDAEQIATSYEVGSLVRYNCLKNGYQLSDPHPLLCVLVGTSPFWNTTMPYCVDVQAPFLSCPVGSKNVRKYSTMEENGLGMPFASDNTGIASMVVSPVYCTLTQPLVEEMVVTYITEDFVGLGDACTVSIFILDEELPRIICPNNAIVLLEEPNYSGSFTMGEDAVATAADNSGSVLVQYSTDALLFTAADHRRVEMVHITATDPSGNTAECDFFVQALVQPCSPLTLIAPDYVTKTCISTGTGYLCTGMCPEDLYFRNAQTQELVYFCEQGQEWSPAARIPECVASPTVASFFITWKIRSTEVFASTLQTRDVCTDLVLANFRQCTICRTNTETRLETWFGTIGRISQVTIALLDSRVDGSFIDAELELALTPDGFLTSEYTDAYSFLGNVADRSLETFELTEASGCSGVTWTHRLDPVYEFRCPQEYVILTGSLGPYPCVPCPPGEFYDVGLSDCQPCARGTYQTEFGQLSCIDCPPGAYTLLLGCSSFLECIPKCPAGYTSADSLPPCDPCPIGTYGFDCLTCPTGTTTQLIGSPNILSCVDLCPAGQYSVTGHQPCESCPYGYYSDTLGNTDCTRCPFTETTDQTGANNEVFCTPTPLCTKCLRSVSCEVLDSHTLCVCPDGYTGQLCESEIDECSSNPCFFGKLCIDRVNAYECICPSGYSGDQCENDPDNCIGNDCKYGSMCQDLENDYNCKCLSGGGYVGDRCDIAVDICDLQPCANGAVCVALTDTRRKCVCPSGYHGEDCATPIDDCASNPCYHGATCIDDIFRYECRCTAEYYGTLCERRWNPCGLITCDPGFCVDDYENDAAYCICPEGYSDAAVTSCIVNNPCLPDPCDNGLCSSSGATYTCTCDSGYSGSTCAHNLDDCEPDPCLYGDCYDLVEGFVCQCWDGYEGDLCHEDTDDCLPNPCQNGANCVDLVDDFRCECTPGFMGVLCTADINECQWDLCRNGGVCRNEQGSYRCDCALGWSGKHCDDLDTSCESFPCENDGTCFDLFQDYFCSCLPGTTGQTCSIEQAVCDLVNPCLHGGSCFQQSLTYTPKCSCREEFVGLGCEYHVALCDLNPCKNEGRCEAILDDYICHCLTGYSGDICAVVKDVCDAKPCVPEADCVQLADEEYGCRCSPGLTGPTCEKDANNDFDLYFYIPSAYAEVITPFGIDGIEHLSFSLWLRPDKPGRVLTIYCLGPRASSEPVEMIYVNTSTHLTVGISLPFWGHRIFELPFEIDEVPFWIHFAVSLNLESSLMDIYYNGAHIQEYLSRGLQSAIPDLLLPRLGHTLEEEDGSFVGAVSQFFMWHRELDYEMDIKPVNSFLRPQCTLVNDKDLLIDWAGVTMGKGVTRRTPARCQDQLILNVPVTALSNQGQSIPPPGPTLGYWTTVHQAGIAGHNLNATNNRSLENCMHMCENTYICRSIDYGWMDRLATYECLLSDKTKDQVPEAFSKYNNHSYYELSRYRRKQRPVVNYCPDDLYIFSGQRYTQVLWNEPQFVNYHTIFKSAQSGWLFEWGVHFISYLAVTLEGYATACHFKIYVYYWDCDSWDPVLDGGLTCYKESIGFPWCTLECKDPDTMLCNSVPSAISCTPWGFYDPIHLTIPHIVGECSEISSQTSDITLSVFYPVLAQTYTIKDLLEQMSVEAYSTLPAVCDKDICVKPAVECEPDIGCTVTAHFTVENVPVSYGRYKLYVAEVFQQILEYPKGSIFDFTDDYISIINGIPTSYELEQIDYCVQGTVPSHRFDPQTGKPTCVLCCMGTFHNAVTGVCELCPRGSYQPSKGQMLCLPCPSDMTTQAPGAVHFDQCQEMCSVGHYFDPETNECRLCPLGFYQDEPGQYWCKTCGLDESTHQTGTTHRDLCYSVCDAGYSMAVDGHCKPCNIGYYRPRGDHPHCIMCPLGTITSDIGAQSLADCSVAACEKGEFLDVKTNICEPCPKSTYQELQWQTSCVPCMESYRTDFLGSHTADDCKFYCPSGYEEVSLEVCQICPKTTFKNYFLDPYGPCLPCPHGRTTQGDGAQTIDECNTEYCVKGLYLDEPRNKCELCPLNTYQPADLMTDCIPCPPSTRTDHTGASSLTECRFYCPSGFEESSPLMCTGCPVGKYKDNSRDVYGACVPCPTDYITASENSTSFAHCNVANCSAGSHLSHDQSVCIPCAVGFYQPTHWQSECMACPVQHSTEDMGSYSLEHCLFYCVSGSEVSEGGNKTCTKCQRGFFKDNEEHMFGVCKPCPDGWTTLDNSAKSVADCWQAGCMPGEFRNADTNKCELCPINYYQPAKWMDSCVHCGSDDFTTEHMGAIEQSQCRFVCESGYKQWPRGTMECVACPRGFYKDNDVNPLGDCMRCPVGIITPGEGTTSAAGCSQAACDAGSYRDEEDNVCIHCPLGTYQPEIWQPSCIRCEAGFSTVEEGSLYARQCRRSCPAGQEDRDGGCYPCNYGYFKARESVLHCFECPRRRLTLNMGSQDESECLYEHCHPGFRYNLMIEKCEECPRGFYREGSKGPLCVQCPLDTTTAFPASTSVMECTQTTCPPGTYLVEASNVCKHCPMGSYQPDKWQSVCISCPPVHTTHKVGAIHQHECYSTNECEMGTHNCSPYAECENTEEAFKCKCKEYFVGNGTTCTHVCEHGYCKNGATCSTDDDTGAPKCTCKINYQGEQCAVRMPVRSTNTAMVSGVVVAVVILIILAVFLLVCCLLMGRARRRDMTCEYVYEEPKAPIMPCFPRPIYPHVPYNLTMLPANYGSCMNPRTNYLLNTNPPPYFDDTDQDALCMEEDVLLQPSVYTVGQGLEESAGPLPWPGLQVGTTSVINLARPGGKCGGTCGDT